jgi:hypothetical protein
VGVLRGRPRRVRGHWRQTLTLVNQVTVPLVAPLGLVFDRLGRGTRLRHAVGRSRASPPFHSPYVLVAPWADGLFPSGAVLTVTVEFAGDRPHYHLRVFAGPGVI